MACEFKISLNTGKGVEEITLPSPTVISENQEEAVRQFLDALKAHPAKANKLVQLIDESLLNQRKTPLKEVDLYCALNIIADNIRQLGVDVQLVEDYQMKQIGFPEGTEAGVAEGKIYINTSVATTTAPLHEFTHLIFGVMKADKYSDFSRAMEIITKIPQFQEIYKNLPAEYNHFMELDRKEEAFVRLIEGIIDNKLSYEIIPEYDELNNIMVKHLQNTFGLENVIDFISYLKGPLSQIGSDSKLLKPKKIAKTGYSDYQQKVIKSAKVMNYIESLIKEGIITEGECL